MSFFFLTPQMSYPVCQPVCPKRPNHHNHMTMPDNSLTLYIRDISRTPLLTVS